MNQQVFRPRTSAMASSSVTVAARCDRLPILGPQGHQAALSRPGWYSGLAQDTRYAVMSRESRNRLDERTTQTHASHASSAVVGRRGRCAYADTHDPP